MGGYIYRGESWDAPKKREPMARLERVHAVAFCDMKTCTGLAAWRIGSGSRSVAFCPRHTLMTMKDRRLWKAGTRPRSLG